MQLNCSACDCIHNQKENCFAHIISVNKSGSGKSSKDVFCNTYSKNTDSYKNTAVEHMGYPTIGDGILTQEYANDFVSENPNITCNASKCTHNKNYECCANHVDILQPNGLMCQCKTFCPK
jgi:hypothetical protein